jgi:ElaB/YqjD/DUF883 family membrane-anchored ribosome-binding protein
MSQQQFSGDAAAASGSKSRTETIKEAASDAFTKASEMARETGAKAKQAASDTAATINEQVKEMLDKQIGNSWGFAGQVASSFKLAADDLDQKSPFAAGLVRNFAGKVENYAEEFQDQTVEQVVRSASDFTRRQPALVFGLAAVAGFFMFRTMKTAQGNASSPSIAPEQNEEPGGYHG